MDDRTTVALVEMMNAVNAGDAARYARDALGGEFVVVARGCPPGLGSYVDWRDKLDARLAAAMMSINAIKGVGFGMGFDLAARRSSEVQDEIVSEDGRLARNSNRLGGLEGGMSNGEPVIVAAAMKPISTIAKALRTVDLQTGEPTRAFNQSSKSSQSTSCHFSARASGDSAPSIISANPVANCWRRSNPSASSSCRASNGR